MELNKKIVKVGAVSALLVGLTGACQAGFLHRTFQGCFEAHGNRYKVDTDGTISIAKQQAYPYGTFVYGGGYSTTGCNSNPCSGSAQPQVQMYWDTKLTFSNVDELKNTIADLQKVEKEIEEADKNDK